MSGAAAAASGSGAAGAAAAIANAIKASGAIVQIEADAFEALVEKAPSCLVVHTEGGVFSTTHKYLTSHRGLFFYAKSKRPLRLPSATDVIEAKSIWIPG